MYDMETGCVMCMRIVQTFECLQQSADDSLRIFIHGNMQLPWVSDMLLPWVSDMLLPRDSDMLLPRVSDMLLPWVSDMLLPWVSDMQLCTFPWV